MKHVIVIDDNPIMQAVAKRCFGVRGVIVPATLDDLSRLPTVGVALVVCDRIMSCDWEAARDAYVASVPDAAVVEWTCAEGLAHCASARCSRVFNKAGSDNELRALIRHSLS